MTDTDPALAGLSDPRLVRQPSQNRSQDRRGERVLMVQVDFGDLDLKEAIEEARMLAESAGAEVVEICAPAQHITIADRTMTLPNGDLQPGRDFGGQQSPGNDRTAVVPRRRTEADGGDFRHLSVVPF